MHYDAGCQCTQGLLLADYFKSIITGQNLPPDLDIEARNSIYYKQYDPSKPLWIARPQQLTDSDLTNAFTPSQPGQVAAATSHRHRRPSSTWGYGFAVHLWYFNQDAKNQTVGLIRQAGFNWMKVQVEWSNIETAPGQYDWSQLDQIVETGNTGSLKMLLSVVDAPAFYQHADQRPARQATRIRSRRSCRRSRARYAGKVQAYEIWNEENLSREMGSGNVDPSNYLPLLMAGYTGLKAGDSTATRPARRAQPDRRQHSGRVDRRPELSAAVVRAQWRPGQRLFRRPVGAPERVLESAQLHARHAAVQPVRRVQQQRQLLRLHARQPVPRPDGRAGRSATRRSGSPSSATARTRRRRRATSTARRSTPRRRPTSWSRRSRWRATWTTWRA